MKAFVISLAANEYSKEVTDRCIKSAKQVGLDVERFFGVNKQDALEVMKSHNLKWTWAGPKNNQKQKCPITKLQQFPYTAKDIRAKIGCSMSHYLLWKRCVAMNEPLLILEHDSVFLRPLPDFEFNGICQINDPKGATRKGDFWHRQMVARGKDGVFPKTGILTPSESIAGIPDGLAGNSAYAIKPWAANEAINKFHELGVWPNDATLCIQLFPYLEEYYPFVTKAVQGTSTSTT